ncbi:MAG: UDP-glucose 4-epimerase GalE [Desulfobacterales bacterium CG23_combo_of_CG06-09_8_20_14_all_51_8]|nr:MAG: UDP-glucose 4-epimerase GalE [Desulfobacterales bacterium CG23_combo_of_CG06-09_8_20_14_all_51_8]
MNILLTGGAGYIGSHTCVVLLEKEHHVIVVDNLCNSKFEAIKRVEAITGKKVIFYQEDLRNTPGMDAIFRNNAINAVIHFAGLKSVAESVARPLDYYGNNINGTLSLCSVMAAHGVKNLVFSSSATVYGDPEVVPADETAPVRPFNPYGRSKLFIEEILTDLHHSDLSWNIALLRYFNPVGAHPSGRIGEDPSDIPNNLMPYIARVAVGRLSELNVYGDDYDTPDGTGVRDYIHVMDLAEGHLKALEKLATNSGLVTYNLGTGKGFSVLEMVAAFKRASGKPIPYKIVGRRPGDVATCYANPSLAGRELCWTARRGIDEMCADAWQWQSMNPGGYGETG